MLIPHLVTSNKKYHFSRNILYKLRFQIKLSLYSYVNSTYSTSKIFTHMLELIILSQEKIIIILDIKNID